MAASLNKTMIVGNIGSDVEMRFTPSGKPTSSFRVATNSRYTNKQGEKVEETEWFSVVTWGKTAELCNQYLHKGSTVFVEGRNKTRSWEGNDNVKHYRTELIAERVLFLDKQGVGQPAAGTSPQAPDDDNPDITPEDLPF